MQDVNTLLTNCFWREWSLRDDDFMKYAKGKWTQPQLLEFIADKDKVDTALTLLMTETKNIKNMKNARGTKK